jgi:hypothetical protein
MPQPVLPLTLEEINRFAYHPANEITGPLHESIRGHALGLAQAIAERVPAGRHRACALTAVQEAMMWANAGIACDSAQTGV